MALWWWVPCGFKPFAEQRAHNLNVHFVGSRFFPCCLGFFFASGVIMYEKLLLFGCYFVSVFWGQEIQN